MTETISITLDSEDKKFFETQSGIPIRDSLKILINSMKYGGKFELDPFWSDENIAELKSRIENDKFVEHELIEVD